MGQQVYAVRHCFAIQLALLISSATDCKVIFAQPHQMTNACVVFTRCRVLTPPSCVCQWLTTGLVVSETNVIAKRTNLFVQVSVSCDRHRFRHAVPRHLMPLSPLAPPKIMGQQVGWLMPPSCFCQWLLHQTHCSAV